jgi:hypothetical protein
MPNHTPNRTRRLRRRRMIRLPAAMDAVLVAMAEERGLTVSELVREAVARCFILPGLVPGAHDLCHLGTSAATEGDGGRG